MEAAATAGDEQIQLPALLSLPTFLPGEWNKAVDSGSFSFLLPFIHGSRSVFYHKLTENNKRLADLVLDWLQPKTNPKHHQEESVGRTRVSHSGLW